MTVVRLVLASTSPRRAELLRAAGFTFDTCGVEIDETPRPDESPDAYVRRLAMEKSAKAIQILGHGRNLDAGYSSQRNQSQGGNINREPMIVLAADTAVVIDGEILGKPQDDQDMARMLRRLSGCRHEVMTGVSVRHGERELGCVECTAVHFAVLSSEDVAWYVESGEGRDKAGGYAIQGLASRFVPRIGGSYSNVVGLPITVVCELLRAIVAG
jgi:septum formation protein